MHDKSPVVITLGEWSVADPPKGIVSVTGLLLAFRYSRRGVASNQVVEVLWSDLTSNSDQSYPLTPRVLDDLPLQLKAEEVYSFEIFRSRWLPFARKCGFEEPSRNFSALKRPVIVEVVAPLKRYRDVLEFKLPTIYEGKISAPFKQRLAQRLNHNWLRILGIDAPLISQAAPPPPPPPQQQQQYKPVSQFEVYRRNVAADPSLALIADMIGGIKEEFPDSTMIPQSTQSDSHSQLNEPLESQALPLESQNNSHHAQFQFQIEIDQGGRERELQLPLLSNSHSHSQRKDHSLSNSQLQVDATSTQLSSEQDWVMLKVIGHRPTDLHIQNITSGELEWNDSIEIYAKCSLGRVIVIQFKSFASISHYIPTSNYEIPTELSIPSRYIPNNFEQPLTILL